jgi:ABC-type cobalamin/Fe3+-siderophores transport system ATPase subunit
MQLIVPTSNQQGLTETIDTKNHPIVIVGSNGSGKSRFAAQVESYNQDTQRVAHISAHRALKIPTHAKLVSLDEASNALRSTNDNGSNKTNRYNSGSVFLQDDYGNVLSALFAQENKRNAEYVKLSQSNSIHKTKVSDSSIDKIKKLWNDILPHRRINFSDSQVTAEVVGKNQTSYQGKEMSDGERVALYLIGYCLSVQANAIIIVDEPELHLHRVLMSNLWNQVEEARPDCQFIYITHDLEFASSRTKAKKIWVQSFSGGNRWVWRLVPELEEIPEELTLEIIGSRKPILFVEGEKGSYDYELFQYIFPEFTVLPRGGGSKVIESTKALRGNASLHSIEAWGLVDRDYKSVEEIASIEQNHIKVCDVAEIENLLLTPELIALVARHQGHADATEFIEATVNFVITHLQREFDKEVSYTTSLEINYRLNAFNKKKLGLAAIKQAVTDLSTTIDVDAIYERHRALYQDIIDRRDLKAALRHYTNKGLLPNMSNILKMGKGEYDKLIIRLLKTDKKAEIVAALKQYVPTIEANTTTNSAAPVPATTV